VGTSSLIFLRPSQPAGARLQKDTFMPLNLSVPAPPPLPKGRVDQAYFNAACSACQEFFQLNSDLPYHELLIILIQLCIEAGANTEPSVIAAIATLGKYPKTQIAVVLKKSSGSNPKLHRWWVDGAGAYSLHPNAP
jgi:hypothetical protein